MKSILGYQEVIEVVEEGFHVLSEKAIDVEKVLFKQNKKKDCKVSILIHQCVDEAHFEKIAGATTSNDVWQILDQWSEEVEKLNKVRLQTMRH